MASVMEKKENNVVVLTIDVTPEAFADALQRSFKKNAGKFNIPGFRKGKAPMHLVTKYYGEGVLYDDAIDFAANPAYIAAIAEHKINPVSRPDLDIQSISREQGITFTVEVTVKPEVVLGDYLGVQAESPEFPVSEEDVDRDLTRVQERNARLLPVEGRGIEDGDTANIDYEGFNDGVPFDGGKGASYDLKIGSGTFIPGFEDALIGKNAGESFELPISFPADYAGKELAGQDVIFNVTINEVKFRELPKLDDEFAKDVSEFDTLDAYKASLRAKLEESAANRAKGVFEDNVIKAVVANASIDVPAVMIESEIDQMVNEQSQQMRYQGIELEQYLGYIGQTVETFREQLKESAEVRVRTNLVLEAISATEALTATEYEIDEEIARMAVSYGMTAEDLKSRIAPGGENSLVADNVVRNKTIALLTEKAIKVAVAAEDEESAKKPAKAKAKIAPKKKAEKAEAEVTETAE
ncbi:MAG: trigger factor [Eubacteriales bacterium]|nr:trigger factor [Eubacteriales bacterium]